ncbi:MAG: hypothetical protein ACO1OT_02685 [Heyndrickxia sp.]
MTYSSIFTHFFPVFHYTFACLFLFFLLPRFLFSLDYEDRWERLFAGYVKMTFFLIMIGYILVITKLYEVISLFLIFFSIIGYRYIRKEHSQNSNSIWNQLLNKLFDLLDGIVKTSPKLFIQGTIQRFKAVFKIWRHHFSWLWLTEFISLMVIIGYSTFLRFYDTFTHAAPPLSDSYVTLAWMKYIDGRVLFHDGIYPQGFHIYLATIFKFAAVNALFILRYTGPLNTVLITLGFYIVVRKLTNSGIGALVAAYMYGIYWTVAPFFPIDRQAATNSQEFSFIFIFPAVYFLLKYFDTKRKENLSIGIMCTAIIGLVHSLAFALVGYLIGMIAVSGMIVFKRRWKQTIRVCAGAICTVIISLIPLGAGLLMGKGLNSSSAEYLVDRKQNTFHLSTLHHLDYLTLGMIVILFLYLISKKGSKQDRFIGLFTVLSGLGVFFLYYAGGALTQSTLIASRSIELWGLLIPFCVGISLSLLIKNWKGNIRFTLYVITSVVLIVSLFALQPKPIIPYKLEHDENIEQYLRICKEFLPKEWLIVSQDEGYSVSLGTGYHMHLADFLATYDPRKENLTKIGTGDIDQNLPPHIFIFQEKKIFKVSKSNSVYSLLAPKYKKREVQYKQISKWINIHKRSGYKVKVYFEDENIIVYRLDIPQKNNR